MPVLDANQRLALNNLLVATDFSQPSEIALLYALAIVRRYGSKLYVANAVRTEGYFLFGSDAMQRALNDAWREAHTAMTDQLIAGRLAGVNHEVLVAQGEVWPVLSRIILERQIDLLVLGTRGRSGIGKLLLGSTAEDIFRQASCPVLTVGPNVPLDQVPESGAQRILFCTGFSHHSLRAGGYALSLAQQQQAALILLHVVPNIPSDSPDMRQQLVNEGKKRLRELIPADARLTGEPVCLVDFGSAGEVIVKTAIEQKADVVVLGIRKSEGFARRVRWATAYEVVSNAPCPVLTVRTLEPA